MSCGEDSDKEGSGTSSLNHPDHGLKTSCVKGGTHPKKRLVELLEAGPPVGGGQAACWTFVLIRVLIWREFGVLYNCQYVCTLLHNLGFSFQKARFVSDHLDTARRHAWLQEDWPRILRAATRRKGL